MASASCTLPSTPTEREGVGRDSLHRYFLSAKQLELTLSWATNQLVRLGAMMAAEPV